MTKASPWILRSHLRILGPLRQGLVERCGFSRHWLGVLRGSCASWVRISEASTEQGNRQEEQPPQRDEGKHRKTS